MRIAVRVAPRPVIARDRELELEPLVVRLEIFVGDRPVLPHPVTRSDLEVRRVKARAVAGVVDHRTADAMAAVVLAELDRIRAADDPLENSFAIQAWLFLDRKKGHANRIFAGRR